MPADAFANPDRVPSLDDVDPEVRGGLKSEADRMECALIAEDYYQGRGRKYLKPREAESQEDFDAKPKRTSKLTRKVVRLIAGQLYGAAPTRQVTGPEAVQAWYENSVIAGCNADVQLKAAVASASLGHVAAIEIEATGDPERPVRLWVWKPNEFAVWGSDDDPACPWAVCTRSLVSAGPGKVRAKYSLWSAMERRVYYTENFGKGESPGGRPATIPGPSGPSPYPGVLPFVFIRHEPAVTEFWEGGIGDALVHLNADADRVLTDIAVHMGRFLSPRGFMTNVAPGNTFVDRVGDFTRLVPDAAARADGAKADPTVFYLQAQLGAEAAWLDLKNYVDQELENLDIPAQMIRTTDSSSDLSGVAIVAKQVPFYEAARARQPMAAQAETELFAKCCAVAAIYYGDNTLLAAARIPAIQCDWPEPKVPLPTAERDIADQWELDQGLADPFEILARRRGLTLAQAEDAAEAIAERRKQWNTLMAGTEPEPGSGAPGAPVAPIVDPGAETGADGEIKGAMNDDGADA